MLSPGARLRAAAVATGVAVATLALGGGVAGAALVADYRLQDTFAAAAEGVPELTPLGDVAFATEDVDGAQRRVLRFGCNSGVAASTADLVPADEYSVAVLFRMDEMAGHQRLLDFKGGTQDEGLYVVNGGLLFASAVSEGTQVAENAYVQVVLTRTAAGAVTVYANGEQALTFDDAESEFAIIEDGQLRFFRDNETEGGTEDAAAGAVARIRLWDHTLSSAEVAALDDTPPAPGPTTGSPVFCADTPPEGDPPVAEETPRFEGDGSSDVRRIAIQVCQFLFPEPDGARTVVLARNDVFADALAGSPLAGNDSCVLYTTGGADATLDAETAAEIDRALPPGAPVRILGGESAVSPQVASQLRADGYAVERFSGPSRFETAAAIARVVRAEAPGGQDAMLAWGRNFPDAVTGGAYGARTGTPILLTETAELHPATAAVLRELGVTRTFVLGGPGVVSEAAAAQAPGAERISGPNRMATAVAVATRLWPTTAPTVSAVVVCNIEREDGWALTLAAAPLSARDGAPQVGVGTNTYPAETQAYIQSLAPPAATAYIMGNEEFISDAVAAQVAADVG